VTKMFKDNSDVAFCDVNLSQEQIRDIHGESQSPGAGGWPTIRYFNKGTGYGGKPYPKKTDEAMCDELGNNENMQAYVEEMGGTSLCTVATEVGCSDKEKDFIKKWQAKVAAADAAVAKKEFTRLKGMDKGAMKPDSAKWLGQRAAILKQLGSVGKDEL